MGLYKILLAQPAPYPLVYDLDKLIDGITAENRHEEIDFGKPAGKEIW